MKGNQAYEKNNFIKFRFTQRLKISICSIKKWDFSIFTGYYWQEVKFPKDLRLKKQLQTPMALQLKTGACHNVPPTKASKSAPASLVPAHRPRHSQSPPTMTAAFLTLVFSPPSKQHKCTRISTLNHLGFRTPILGTSLSGDLTTAVLSLTTPETNTWWAFYAWHLWDTENTVSLVLSTCGDTHMREHGFVLSTGL